MSDDFSFLQRATSFGVWQLLPDPRSAFYRPISRELYFSFLNLLGSDKPIWGHLINALLSTAAVVLIAIFARRIGGTKLGVLSALFLALLGPLPILVAWVSGAQDLFAMVFIGAALNFELNGRRILSMACVAAALLSKETAVFFLPGLISLRYLVTGSRRELIRSALPYVALVVAWVAIHPRMQSFFREGFVTGPAGYIGVDNPFILRSSIRMAGTFLNFPPTGMSTPWPSWLTLPLVGALVLIAGLFWADLRDGREDAQRPLPDRRILWIGALLGIVPAVLTVASTKHWFPYYACMPAIGTSILLAMPFRSRRWRLSIVAASGFLILGVWYRGTDLGKATMPAEANFRSTSNCLKRVEKDLRKLHSQFPDSARIYVSAETSPEKGVQLHLYHGQVMRTWYVNNTVVALPAEYQDTTYWPRYLFWVNPACEVFEVTLPELRVRSPGPRPSYLAYQRTMRSYALGAWAAGDVDRGVGVLLNMQEADQLSWDFDRRLAGVLLVASGREGEANALLRGFPKPGRGQALDGVRAVLTPSLPRPGLDDAAFKVFGLETSDAEAFRFLMFYFSDRIQLQKAKRMAERLLELRPGDEEATAMIEAIQAVPEWEAVLVAPEGEPNFPIY